jgi:hypothetical protein
LVSSGDVARQNATTTDLDVVGVGPDREHHLEILRAAHASPTDHLTRLLLQVRATTGLVR